MVPETMKYKWLSASRSVYIPKSLAREVLNLAVVGRGFKSDLHTDKNEMTVKDS